MTPMEAATAEWLTRLGVRNYAKSSVRTYAHCLALLSPGAQSAEFDYSASPTKQDEDRLVACLREAIGI